ncbi:MAG: NADPH:quinone reductase [Pirellulales bacterium]
MRAAYITQTGPAESLVVGDLPDPEPGVGQVRVRVNTATVNPVDTFHRAGAIAAPLPFPWVPGCDLAGVVDKLGPGASKFQVGDRVWGTNQGVMGRQGTLAELAVVDEHWLYPTPADVSDDAAAALSLVGITAHLGLAQCAKPVAGETLFVNGGTGGVGSIVIQMAKIFGLRVVTTVGTDEKAELAKSLGADVTICYKTTDVDAAIRAAAPQGVDIWWETQLDPNFERAIPLLAERGRMIVMAGRKARPVFPSGEFYAKSCALFGFVMYKATPAEQAAAAADINRWATEGRLKPLIGRTFPLDEAAAAHALQEANTVGKAGTLSGKILVKP